MQPQGTSLINVQYFSNVIKQTTNLIAQLNYFKNGTFGQDVIQEAEQQLQQELQSLTNQIIPDIMAQVNAINQDIAKLLPIIPLVTFSITDLPSVISFLTNLQSEVLGLQFLTPYTNMVSQVAQLITELASLTSAIKTASNTIVNSSQSSGGTPVAPVQIPGSPSIQQRESVHVTFTVTRA